MKYGQVPFNKPYLTLEEELAQRDYLNNPPQISESTVTDTANVVHIRRTTTSSTGQVSTIYLNPQTNQPSSPTFPLVG